ncbi:MAG TPA: hypothetical protein VHD56_16570 [Tepidisphaeraceae bacterium]|nr:hypothetical protein [Tepidisphaeraceae bacterium]
MNRFEDDKVGKLDSAIYRPPDTVVRNQPAFLSPDGQQALVSLSLTSAPSSGATRCSIGGQVRATVARKIVLDSSDPISLFKGRDFKAGPFSGTIVSVAQNAPMTPNATNTSYEVMIRFAGRVSNLLRFEIVDKKTGRTLVDRNILLQESQQQSNAQSISFPVALAQVPEEVIFRVQHCEKIETVDLPFDISTTVGL